MFARCAYSDTTCFTTGEVYSVDLLNGCKRGAEPGGLEIPLWPVVMFLAFFDATVEQIRRAIKERKK